MERTFEDELRELHILPVSPLGIALVRLNARIEALEGQVAEVPPIVADPEKYIR